MPISVFVILLLEQTRYLGIDLIDQLAPLAAATLLLEVLGPHRDAASACALPAKAPASPEMICRSNPSSTSALAVARRRAGAAARQPERLRPASTPAPTCCSCWRSAASRQRGARDHRKHDRDVHRRADRPRRCWRSCARSATRWCAARRQAQHRRRAAAAPIRSSNGASGASSPSRASSELSELYGYLAKQFTIFGQHVHIGCPTATRRCCCCTRCRATCRTSSRCRPRRRSCRAATRCSIRRG